MEPIYEPDTRDLTNNDNGSILSEESLQSLSKSFTKIIPKDGARNHGSDLKHIRSLHNDLLWTAGSANLSFTHGAAALGCLSGFLEQCSLSNIAEINALPFSFSSWFKAFRIYLIRTDNNKPKPVRRLLLTLTNLVSKHPIKIEQQSLTSHAICLATRAIRGANEVGSAKAAIQVLEHFISAKVVDAIRITRIITSKQPISDREPQVGRDSIASNYIRTVTALVSSVLEWSQYPDCAPIVGRFLPTFFISLADINNGQFVHSMVDALLPLWMVPVKNSLQRQQGSSETYENHILPGLLLSNSALNKAFLSALPLDDIVNGNYGKHTVADIQLCIMVARVDSSLSCKPAPPVAQEGAQGLDDVSGLQKVQGKAVDLGKDTSQIETDPESFAMCLLEHSVSAVRVSAFALLTSSSKSTSLLSANVLSCMQRCIPFFHVESNAKARNEIIALMKKLCTRLRVIIVSSMRDQQDLVHVYREQPPVLPFGTSAIEQRKQEDLTRELQRHISFWLWYIHFLVHELRPTASYQSHITALTVLHWLLKDCASVQAKMLKANEEYLKLLSEHLTPTMILRPLLDLLLDPFDDVRHVVHMIMKEWMFTSQVLLSPEPRRKGHDIALNPVGICGPPEAKDLLCGAIKKAELQAAETARADHADGVGRLYEVCYGFNSDITVLDELVHCLEGDVNLSNKNLPSALNNAPLHGHLIALRHIIGRPDYWTLLNASTARVKSIWADYNERIIAICDNVWEAVRDVLCFDAPEGTQITDEDVDDLNVGSKDALSYCWRALKESSSLMHSIITSKGYSPSPCDTYINLVRFGQLSLEQLGELRHRGAFSTVSLTFSACCVACVRSGDVALMEVSKAWYQEALECMAQNASTLTRRSAGLPAMITGILAAYPSGAFFNDVVMDLQAIADGPVTSNGDFEEASLPQVHALNCLKDIFTDARFGTSTEAHIADTMGIAASCLESHVWAIRNCGLMLFKSLLRRLNGGTDTASSKVSSSYRRSSNTAYEKCPNLPELILKLLSAGIHVQNTGSEVHLSDIGSSLIMNNQSVFAALEVVERSGVPYAHKAEIRDALWHFAGCNDWSLREKAAKVLSLVENDNGIDKQASHLLATDWGSYNVMHGRLLSLRFTISRARMPLGGDTLRAYERLPPVFGEHLDDLVINSLCPITAAAFLDCIAELAVVLIKSRSSAVESDSPELPELLQRVAEQRVSASVTAYALGNKSLARCHFLNDFIKQVQAQPGHATLDRTPYQPPRLHMNAITIMDEAQQFDSNENMLAILSHTSSEELHFISTAVQSAEENSTIQSGLSNGPRGADFAFALSGRPQGKAYIGGHGEVSSEQPLVNWIRRLQSAGSEYSELRTRTAAAASLKGFFEVLLDNQIKPKPEVALLEVYLALYDTLIDDDEDVRDQGAATVSSLISAVESSPSREVTLSLSPPAAKQKLLEFIEKGYHSSTQLYMKAMERLTGLRLKSEVVSSDKNAINVDIDNRPKLRPVADIAVEAQKPQVAVFVEEKQNLYIDEVTEAELWAEVLLGLDADACVAEMAATLESWTTNGLSYFIDDLRQRQDSAYGSTSVPEVFTLFVRVILSAKVIFARSASAIGQGSIPYEHSFKLLNEIVELGRIRGLHSLLLDRVEIILREILKGTGD